MPTAVLGPGDMIASLGKIPPAGVTQILAPRLRYYVIYDVFRYWLQVLPEPCDPRDIEFTKKCTPGLPRLPQGRAENL